jgi:hypothetical protein
MRLSYIIFLRRVPKGVELWNAVLKSDEKTKIQEKPDVIK